MNTIPMCSNVRAKASIFIAVPFLMAPTAMAATVTPSAGANTTSAWQQDWNNATVTSSSGFKLPGASAGDTAVFNNGRVIQVNSIVDIVAGAVFVNNTDNSGSPSATLEINTGGSLTAGAITISQNTDAGLLKVQGGTLNSGTVTVKDNGTAIISSGVLNSGAISVQPLSTVAAGLFNITGGTVNAGGAVTNSGTVNVSGGTLATGGNAITVSTGNFNIHGGAVTTAAATALNGGAMTLTSGSFANNATGARTVLASGAGTLNLTSGTFTAQGQDPTHALTLGTKNINISGGVLDLSGGQVIFTNSPIITITANAATITTDRFNSNSTERAVTLNYNFGATGVSKIKSNAFAGLANATFNLDGSSYTGGAGSHTVFEATNFTSTPAPLNVTGFGVNGVDYTTANTSTQVNLNVLNATLYWQGDKVGGSGNSWIATAGSASNWSLTQGSYTSTLAIPRYTTNMVFSASGAASQNTVLGADVSANSLTFNDSAAVTIGGAGTLTLHSNASGVGSSAITVSASAANPTISADVALANSQTWNVDENKGLMVSGIVSGEAKSLTFVGAGLADTAGTLTLSGANTYSGGTTLSNGRININNDSALGTGGVTTANAVSIGNTSGTARTIGNSLVTQGNVFFYLPNDLTVNGTVDLGTSAERAFLLQDSGTLTINGVISGDSGLNQTGVGSLVLAATNTFTGALRAQNGGNISVFSIKNSGVASAAGAGNELTLGTEGTGAPGNLIYTGSGDSTDRTVTLASSAASSASINNNGSGALVFTGLFTNNSTAGNTKTLQLGGTNTGANTISTALGDGTSGGDLALDKLDAGKWILTGTNTYTGATHVTAGTLGVSGSIGASAVTVSNSGSVLASGATGTIGNTVAIESGAILAPGDAGATGTATALGEVTFNNGSIFSWDISSNGTSYDKLIAPSLNDEATTGDAIFRIVAANSAFDDPFWTSGVQTWTDVFTTDGSTEIADWAALFSVSVVDSTFNPITPTTGSFSLSGSTLTWTAVPEPTSALAGMLLAAGILRRRRA